MKIEAVTVCVNYSDFLAWSIPWNKKQFDKWVVVTDKADKDTARLCEYHHVTCMTTDTFYADERSFNKGAGINAGFSLLSMSDWVVHMDADIILPPRTRSILECSHLDTDDIYGIDRLMCKSFADWNRFVMQPEVQHSQEVYVQANAFPLGVRVAKTDQDGYMPIGFFQLWNAAKTGRKHYPEQHGSCCRGDMTFARQWPRKNRVLIPEIVAIHLESEPSPNGANWRGRRTKPFHCGDY